MKNTTTNENMRSLIRKESALYFFRATPFYDLGEFTYNGHLKPDFFYKNMFSKAGQYESIVEEIGTTLNKQGKKTILLVGNQGCGKTIFVHSLEYECTNNEFLYFDFDQDTSNPTLEEYKEKFSAYFHKLISNVQNRTINLRFYSLFKNNKNLILKKINGDNKVDNFFDAFYEVIVKNEQRKITIGDFIKVISNLFFNQILSLIVLWHISEVLVTETIPKSKVFCMDNLDILVNQVIIENFFKEYFWFIRNVDSIINNLNEDYLKNNNITFNKLFVFMLVCRQQTWARVKQLYTHNSSAVHVSTLITGLTNAFDKSEILKKRADYIKNNRDYFGEYFDEVSATLAVLNDFDPLTSGRSNIYRLFNDDYRQCIITFEDIASENPQLIKEYIRQKKYASNYTIQGVRGIVYRYLFEKFQSEGIFHDIGVLKVNNDTPLVSDSRLLLTYLYYNTNEGDFVSFEQIVNDFKGVIEPKERINNCLLAMFRLGFKSCWNELIAFDEIDTDNVTSCDNTKICITNAGREYLNLIATHFEFFNMRVPLKQVCKSALFSAKSMETYQGRLKSYSLDGKEYTLKYNFQEIIYNVMNIVSNCCRKLSDFYEKTMSKRYTSIDEYMNSPFVYGEPDVLHGERIIHTHIRYIDKYRIFLIEHPQFQQDYSDINEILVGFIGEYIRIGESYPKVLSQKSVGYLFPAFKRIIKEIEDSNYTSKKPINVKIKSERT